MYFGCPATYYPADFHEGDNFSNTKFEHIWHQVKEPLTCIGSLRDNFAGHKKTREWLHEFMQIPLIDDKLEWAMSYYHRANKYFSQMADWTYQVEQLPEHWEAFKTDLDIDPEREFPKASTTMNRSVRFAFKSKEEYTKIKKSLEDGSGYPTWDDLYEKNEALASRIATLADKYGYPTGD